MKRILVLAASCLLMAGAANAVVTVNGVPGEDNDNVSPFETLHAAVEFANAGSETIIEITTSSLPAGVTFGGENLNHDLTIRAGNSFTPVIGTGLTFNPTNQEHLVTLQGLAVINNLTDVVDVPLSVGCNVTATNCVFDSNATSATKAAVTCAVASVDSVSTLTLTSCTLRGFTGLEAGRSCRDYVISHCLIEAIPPPAATNPFYSEGITNARNFSPREGTAPTLPRLDENLGFVSISEPRTITITDSIVRAGMPICWPSSKDAKTWNQAEDHVFGPFNATNTVFQSLRSDAATGFPSTIGAPATSLPADQNIVCSFRHCTFFANTYYADGSTTPAKSVNGLLYFVAASHPEIAFWDCLFDCVSSDYLIFDNGAKPDAPNAILTGDGNTYHYRGGNQANRAIIISGSPYQAGVIFEATQHDYVSTNNDDMSTPIFVDNDGHIVAPDPSVVNHAVALNPPVTTDRDGNPRPLPVAAAHSDIGADEVDETTLSNVADWSVY
jgi:hypothetical protein